MSATIRTLTTASIALAMLLVRGSALSAQENPAATTPGINVQERGPVHEAFAQPVAKDAEPAPGVPKQPPPLIPEEPPAQKPAGDNVQWVPGYWAWDSDRNDFLWVSGVWRNVPPDRKWVAGHWEQGNGGWQWVSGYWAASRQAAVQAVPQPPASLENGPSVPAPDDNSFYVPGMWKYGDAGYAWRPGYWAAAYDGWVWNPACYRWSPAGYTYQDGYWDYPLSRRGLLFAPVCFDQPYWNTPGWVYRPGFALNFGLNDLFGSLFVGPGYGHYYFGDYYGPSYAGRGFYPWYAYGRRFHDPLFSYYSWQHRGDAGWQRGLQDTFWGRRNGSAPRGPSPVAPLSHLAHNPGQMHSVVAPARNDQAVHQVGVGRGAAFAPGIHQGSSGVSQRQSFYAAPARSAPAVSPHFASTPGGQHMAQPPAGHVSPGPAPRSFAPSQGGFSRPVAPSRSGPAPRSFAPSQGGFSRPVAPSRSARSFSRPASAARSSGGRGGNSRGGSSRSGGSGRRHK